MAQIVSALTRYTVAVNKSTVPVGTGDQVERIIRQTSPAAQFSVVSDPEFLRGGSAIDNNPAERALRAIGIGRKNWLFAGAANGAETLTRTMTLIETAKMEGLDPQAYLPTPGLPCASSVLRR